MNRTFKKIAMACAAMAVLAYSQSCKKTTLYSGSEEGFMEESSRTFPEAPEWKANWGNFPKMDAPYIRISGQKALKGDWTGALVFPGNKLAHGKLSMNVRATQGVKFGAWADGESAESATIWQLAANQSYDMEIPVTAGSAPAKIWIKLFGVNAYQYVTLFIDNIAYCEDDSGTLAGGAATGSIDTAAYTIFGGNASAATRQKLWEGEDPAETSPRYGAQEREELKKRTAAPFVLDWEEHDQIMRILQNDSLGAKQSREAWYRAMYLVTRARLNDSAVANPKKLYADANGIAAAHGMRGFPLLVANLDYSYRVCSDTACSSTILEDYHLLAAGLPTSYTRSSKIQIAYDPFFVVTDKSGLPGIELCVSGKCQPLEPNGVADIEFDAAGIQKLTVKLDYGATKIQQNLFLEVK
jgi:hypothetical protein